MKRSLAVLVAASLLISLAGCAQVAGTAAPAPAPEAAAEAVEEAVAETAEDAAEAVEETAEAVEEAAEEAVEEAAVMTHEEYMAAAIDDPVVIETYVQAKQSWWDNKATLYTQAEDGAYFIYNSACSEEDYEKLTPGTKIRVSGYKAEWSGEIEIAEGAELTILDGEEFIAPATDVTDLLGDEEGLLAHQNEFVSFKGMTVEAYGQNDDGEDQAFFYNWDGSGEEGNDLYFCVSKDGKKYNFTVESYLCDPSTEVYQAVKELKIGDVIDLEGFLYWYEGVNPHITKVTPAE